MNEENPNLTQISKILETPESYSSFVNRTDLQNLSDLRDQIKSLTLGHLSQTLSPNEKQSKLVSVYIDEFATFACPEFANLISKARSAKFALHFSHQSIGDIMEVSQGF